MAARRMRSAGFPRRGRMIAVLKPSRFGLRGALAVSAALVSAAALSAVLPAAPALAADTATINGSSAFQTISGFGFAEAFGQASQVMNAPAAEQQQALSL